MTVLDVVQMFELLSMVERVLKGKGERSGCLSWGKICERGRASGRGCRDQ